MIIAIIRRNGFRMPKARLTGRAGMICEYFVGLKKSVK
jgi:hypothetical protein